MAWVPMTQRALSAAHMLHPCGSCEASTTHALTEDTWTGPSGTWQLWRAYQWLIFPFRYLLEVTGVMDELVHQVADGNTNHPCDALRDMPYQSWEQLQAWLQKLQAKGLAPGAVTAAEAITWMRGAGWLEPGCRARGSQARYQWDRRDKTPAGAAATGMRLLLKLQPPATGSEQTCKMTWDLASQDFSCHLYRHLVNNHHRMLAVRVHPDIKANYDKPLFLFGRCYEFMRCKENLVFLFATTTYCDGDHLQGGARPPWSINNHSGSRDSSSGDNTGNLISCDGSSCVGGVPAVPELHEAFDSAEPRVCIGRFQTLTTAQANMMESATNTIALPGKVEARLELAVSQTKPLEGEWKLYYTDDVKGRHPDSSGQENKELMTDGAGLAAFNVMERCEGMRSSHGKQEGTAATDRKMGVAQVRMWDERAWPPLLAKGTFFPAANLPPNTIVIPFSMVKAPEKPQHYIGSLFMEDHIMTQILRQPVYTINMSVVEDLWRLASTPGSTLHGPPAACLAAYAAAGSDPLQEAHSLCSAKVEVTNSRFERTSAKYNTELCKLLHDGGVPSAVFLDLQDRQIEKINKIGVEVEVTRAAAAEIGRRSLSYMMQAGFCQIPAGSSGASARARQLSMPAMLHNPCSHVRKMVHKVGVEHRIQLAKNHLELVNGYRLVGGPDWSRSIPEGCVVVIHNGEPVYRQQEVLMYRNPGLKPDDVQRVRQVPPPEAFMDWYFGNGRGLRYGILFSAHGEISLAQKLAGGDFDGDEYLVIEDPVIVTSFQPWSAPASSPRAVSPPQVAFAPGTPALDPTPSTGWTVATPGSARYHGPVSVSPCDPHARGATTSYASPQGSAASPSSGRVGKRDSDPLEPRILEFDHPSKRQSPRPHRVQGAVHGRATPPAAVSTWSQPGINIASAPRAGVSEVPQQAAQSQEAAAPVLAAAWRPVELSAATTRLAAQQQTATHGELDDTIRRLVQPGVQQLDMVKEYLRNQEIDIFKGRVANKWQASSAYYGKWDGGPCSCGSRHPHAVRLASLHAAAMDVKKNGHLKDLQLDLKGLERYWITDKFMFEYNPESVSLDGRPARMGTSGTPAGHQPHQQQQPGQRDITGTPGGIHAVLSARIPPIPDLDAELLNPNAYVPDPDLEKLFHGFEQNEHDRMTERRNTWLKHLREWKAEWKALLALKPKYKRPLKKSDPLRQEEDRHKRALVDKYKHILQNGPEYNQCAEAEMKKEALALYMEVYKHAGQQCWVTGKPQGVGMPFRVAEDLLIEMKAKAFFKGKLPFGLTLASIRLGLRPDDDQDDD